MLIKCLMEQIYKTLKNPKSKNYTMRSKWLDKYKRSIDKSKKSLERGTIVQNTKTTYWALHF